MSTVLALLDDPDLVVDDAVNYIGNPMYQVIGEHRAAVALVLLGAAGVWLVARSTRNGRPLFAGYVEGYQALPSVRRLLFWLVATAGTIHLGLVLGHEPGLYSAAYLVGAVAELWLARGVLTGRYRRRWAAIVLVGALLAYVGSNLAGEPPDQLGLATKLAEITALWIVVSAPSDRRFRRLAGSGAMVVATTVVGIAAWAGAFAGVEDSHHVGEASQPGTLIPVGEDRDPTAVERVAAEEVYDATVAFVARYENPEVAAADGYNIDGMYGLEFHATNDAYKTDGRIFDPERPENLIYAVTPAGPVLIGVMFEMEGIGRSGPAVGGPLTVWHAHDNVCIALTPLALAGLTSPFGLCPFGSLTIPITNEMIHMWTLPGAPERFGHLEEDWLDSYLAALD